MIYYALAFVEVLLLVFVLSAFDRQRKKRKIAAIVNHRKNHSDKEKKTMKELAKKFIGKDCRIYTVMSDGDPEKGIITEVTDEGVLLDDGGGLQAINLEYITRIQEIVKKQKENKKISVKRCFDGE